MNEKELTGKIHSSMYSNDSNRPAFLSQNADRLLVRPTGLEPARSRNGT